MNRFTEMEEYIQDFRIKRMDAKRAYLDDGEKYEMLFSSLLPVLETLIQEQISLQEAGEQGKVKHIIFHRLLSSGYTGSYEISVGMCSAMLYLDKHMSCAYWKPKFIHDGMDKDMEEVRRRLNRKFVRIEEFELLRLKQKLLLDGWQLFCEMLRRLGGEAAQKVLESSLLLEDEIQILYGDYMDRLDAACKAVTGCGNGPEREEDNGQEK